MRLPMARRLASLPGTPVRAVILPLAMLASSCPEHRGCKTPTPAVDRAASGDRLKHRSYAGALRSSRLGLKRWLCTGDVTRLRHSPSTCILLPALVRGRLARSRYVRPRRSPRSGSSTCHPVRDPTTRCSGRTGSGSTVPKARTFELTQIPNYPGVWTDGESRPARPLARSILCCRFERSPPEPHTVQVVREQRLRQHPPHLDRGAPTWLPTAGR